MKCRLPFYIIYDTGFLCFQLDQKEICEAALLHSGGEVLQNSAHFHFQSKSIGFEHDYHFAGAPHIFKHTETACGSPYLKDQETPLIILLSF